jgi:hypothetical protein
MERDMAKASEKHCEAAQMATSSFAPPPYYCSFCLKADHEVAKLCAGHGRIFICDECVEDCRGYMAGRAPARSERNSVADQSSERLLSLLTPIEETVQGKSNQLQLSVETLRSREVSWAKIGEALGISRQSAWERFS